MGKKLDEAIVSIDKQFGANSVMFMGAAPAQKLDVISTGWYSLDVALGIGGLPRGRVVEIFGQESSGKSTLALQVVAQAQKLGGMAAYIDVEHSIDRGYAEKLGVDVNSLLVSQPSCGEEALEICEALIKSGEISVIIVDSVAALVPRSELEGEMGDAQMGLQARLMSQAMRKLTGILAKTNTLCIMINQLRDKIGIVFGNPSTTTGGKALKFYSSVRLELSRIQQLKEGDVIIGARTRAKAVKNKCASPATVAEGDLIFGKGISLEADIIDCAIESGVIEKSGSWLTVEGQRIQGRAAAIEYLIENPEVLSRLKEKL